MKTIILTAIKKFFIAATLGMGIQTNSDNVVVSHVQTANDTVQAKVRTIVNAHHHKIGLIKNSNQLNAFLGELKAEILTMLNQEISLSDKNYALKQALESINPSDKFSIASNIKSVLNNLDSDIANIIKSAIPQVYRTVLGL